MPKKTRKARKPRKPLKDYLPKPLQKLLYYYEKLRKKLSFLKWVDPFTYVDLYLIEKYKIKSPLLQWIIYIAFAFLFAWIIYSGLGLALSTDTPMVVVVSDSMEPVMHRGDVVIVKGLDVEEINAPQATFTSSLNNNPPKSFSEIGDLVYKNEELSEILLFDNQNPTRIPYTKEGDIIVYDTILFNQRARYNLFLPSPKPVRIIHRAVTKINASDGTFFLTKGDNPESITIDQDCGQLSSNGTEKPCISVFPVKADQIHGKALYRIPWIGYIKILLTEPFTDY